jgi:peroxiredoxin
MKPLDERQILTPGTPAPEFNLISNTGEEIILADFRGQPVVLVFYPADFSPVCGDQMVLYNEMLPLFEEFKASVLGISVDGRWSHRAFAESRSIRIPLLADFEPKGSVAQAYGVYRKEDGTSERALFVIDAEGVIRWSYLSPIHINPGADGILRALENLTQFGEADQ